MPSTVADRNLIGLTYLRNAIQQEQERAHMLKLRHTEDLPNLATHYGGEETAFGLCLAMVDGTLRGMEFEPLTDTGAGDAVEAYRG